MGLDRMFVLYFYDNRRLQDAGRRLGGDNVLPLGFLTCQKILQSYLKKVLPADK